MANVAGLDRLKSQLLTSGLSQKDQPLYQVINQLIEFVRQGINENQATFNAIANGGTLPVQTYLTYEDELIGLPNSRRLIAGSGINFNNDGQRLIINGVIPPPFDLEYSENEPSNIPFLGNTFFPVSGDWVNIPYNAANFTTNGATALWTVDSGDVETLAYTLINARTAIIAWAINTSSISAADSTNLRIQLPFTARATGQNLGRYFAAGVGAPANSAIVVGTSLLQFHTLSSTFWPVTVNDLYLFGVIVVPI